MKHLPIAASAALVFALAACAPTAEVAATPEAEVTVQAAVLDDRPVDEQLVDALRAEDLAIVTLALEAGADVETDIGAGLRPIHLATLSGDVQLVQALVDAGADVNTVADSGQSALMMAVRPDFGDIVSVLMTAGASHEIYTDDVWGNAPIHEAAQFGSLKVIQALLDSGVDVDALDTGFEATAFGVAAFYGEVEAMELLFINGADIYHIDVDGHDAWYGAHFTPEPDAVEYLRGLGFE